VLVVVAVLVLVSARAAPRSNAAYRDDLSIPASSVLTAPWSRAEPLAVASEPVLAVVLVPAMASVLPAEPEPQEERSPAEVPAAQA
jgi:hypothetical protein